MATRLINDKGIFEYLELADLMKDSDFEFYLAGDIDNGNPDSLSKSQLDEFVDKSIAYASSTLKQVSSVFIKIGK